MATHKPKVFVSRSDFPEIGISLLKERCDIDLWPSEKGEISREDFLQRIAGKDALLICSHDKINEEVITAAGKNLKVISTISVGLDHIDIDVVQKHSIKLGYVPNVLTEAVAELTIALLLAASRRMLEANKTISRKEWKWTPTWMCGRGLSGSTVGLVGFGRIGQSIAKKLLAFDVTRILYSGPREKTEAKSLGAVYVGFDDLLRESDFVIVTCPLTKETAGMFTREKFSLMKRSAIFVNSARGGVVDQDALVYALENKLIRGAGLDVMTPEPLPADHPLVTMENCVLTPHIGSATIETRNEMCLLGVNNILAVFDGADMPAEYK